MIAGLESESLQAEVTRLRHLVALLKDENEQLRGENVELKEQLAAVEEQSRVFAERHADVAHSDSTSIKSASSNNGRSSTSI